MIKLDKEFKEAIVDMSPVEKDKLLLRLISKDVDLANQLHFQLMEGDSAIEVRKQKILDYIDRSTRCYPDKYYSPGYLMMDMRDCSGCINEYLKITKDKVGEIELQLQMLCSFIEPNMKKILKETKGKRSKLITYVVKRAGKIDALIGKIHEDYQIEFKDLLLVTGKCIRVLDPDLEMVQIHNVNFERFIIEE